MRVMDHFTPVPARQAVGPDVKLRRRILEIEQTRTRQLSALVTGTDGWTDYRRGIGILRTVLEELRQLVGDEV